MTSPPLPRLRAEITPACLLAATIPGIGGGLRQMAMWGIVVVTALLAHELGHALAAVAFGSRATIVLRVFGGVTRADPPLSRRQSLVAIAAGPFMSLVVALGLGIVRRVGSGPWLTAASPWIAMVMSVHAVWGALNLLPILPFDGGRAVLTVVGPQREADAWMISTSAALALAATGLACRSVPAVLLFGVAGVASAHRWFKQRQANALSHLPAQLKAARLLLAQGRTFEAITIAADVAHRARGTATERLALELVAWSYLELDQPKKAEEALGQVLGIGIDPYCQAAVVDGCGRTDEALGILEALYQAGDRRVAAIRLLIDIHVRQGDWTRACEITLAEIDRIGTDDARLVLQRAFDSDALPAARTVVARLFELTAAPDDGLIYASILSRLGERQQANSVLSRIPAETTKDLSDARRERLCALRESPELKDLMDAERDDRMRLTTN